MKPVGTIAHNARIVETENTLLEKKMNELNFKVDNLDSGTIKRFTESGGMIELLAE